MNYLEYTTGLDTPSDSLLQKYNLWNFLKETVKHPIDELKKYDNFWKTYTGEEGHTISPEEVDEYSVYKYRQDNRRAALGKSYLANKASKDWINNGVLPGNSNGLTQSDLENYLKRVSPNNRVDNDE